MLQVADGYQVLDQLAEHAPSVVLLDLRLPGLDGITLCRRIKANPRMARVPVVFMSGSGHLEGWQARAGADAVLAKPFALPQVLLLLQRFVKV